MLVVTVLDLFPLNNAIWGMGNVLRNSFILEYVDQHHLAGPD